MVRAAVSVLAVILVFSVGVAQGASVPVAVSPGSTGATAAVEARCPTFSWGAAEEARAYELVVYALPRDEIEGQDEPVLRARIPGAASSWTPSMGDCFAPGERYAWSVRAVLAAGETEWSRPSLFTVVAGPSLVEVEEALAVLRRHVEVARGREPAESGRSSLARAGETATEASSSSRGFTSPPLSRSLSPSRDAPAPQNRLVEPTAGLRVDTPSLEYGLRAIGGQTGLAGDGYDIGVLGTAAEGTGVRGEGVTAVVGYSKAGGSGPEPYAIGVLGQHEDAGSGQGVRGESVSQFGPSFGVYGQAQSSEGESYGVYGQAEGQVMASYGLYGDAHTVNGFSYGVYGEASASNGIAVGVHGLGDNDDPEFGTTGVWGRSTSQVGTGVKGDVTAQSGTTVGVFGSSSSPEGRGGSFTNLQGGQGLFASGRGKTKDKAVLRVENTEPDRGMAGYFTNNSNYANLHLRNSGLGEVLFLQNGFEPTGGGQWEDGIFIKAVNPDGSDVKFFVSAYGNVHADGTFAGGGADVADMLPAVPGTEPGDVLVIGGDGRLELSSRAFARAVAGVYSTRPGFLGDEAVDVRREDAVPLALAGIVPVKVTTQGGPIRPGDLLVTSSTPGHAMRAGRVRRHGVVIGKALEEFAGKRGRIRMLVVLR